MSQFGISSTAFLGRGGYFYSTCYLLFSSKLSQDSCTSSKFSMQSLNGPLYNVSSLRFSRRQQREAENSLWPTSDHGGALHLNSDIPTYGLSWIDFPSCEISKIRSFVSTDWHLARLSEARHSEILKYKRQQCV